MSRYMHASCQASASIRWWPLRSNAGAVSLLQQQRMCTHGWRKLHARHTQMLCPNSTHEDTHPANGKHVQAHVRPNIKSQHEHPMQPTKNCHGEQPNDKWPRAYVHGAVESTKRATTPGGTTKAEVLANFSPGRTTNRRSAAVPLEACDPSSQRHTHAQHTRPSHTPPHVDW